MSDLGADLRPMLNNSPFTIMPIISKMLSVRMDAWNEMARRTRDIREAERLLWRSSLTPGQRLRYDIRRARIRAVQLWYAKRPTLTLAWEFSVWGKTWGTLDRYRD